MKTLQNCYSENEKYSLTSLNLKKEILNIQLEHMDWDLFTLIRWAYLRTCVIFTYDWKYFYCDDSQMKDIYDLTVDISNIINTEVICSTWAKLFVDILHFLNVESSIVIDPSLHCYVLFELNGITIKADATKGYDLSRVKIGCSTNGFKAVTPTEEFQAKLDLTDQNIGYGQNLYTDKAIKRLKSDFLEDGYTKNQNEFGEIDYDQIVFKIELFQLLINDTEKISKFYDTYFYLSYLSRTLLTQQEKQEILIQPYWCLKPDSDIVNFLAVRDSLQRNIFILKNIKQKYCLERATDEEIQYYVSNYHGKYENLLLQYKKN